MGRITTPAYRLEMTVDRGLWTPGIWRASNGRPTARNLAAYCRGMEDSTKPGGCNAHVGRTRVTSAVIIRQATGAVVARYAAPCQWFAACVNPATTTLAHPVLGAVPICGRCQAKVAEIDALLAANRRDGARSHGGPLT